MGLFAHFVNWRNENHWTRWTKINKRKRFFFWIALFLRCKWNHAKCFAFAFYFWYWIIPLSTTITWKRIFFSLSSFFYVLFNELLLWISFPFCERDEQLPFHTKIKFRRKTKTDNKLFISLFWFIVS